MKQLRTQLAMALLGYATQRDIDASRLCELADVSYDGLLRQPDISQKQMDRLWYNAVQLSGDSLFGLHFGEQSQLAALGVVGEVVRTSKTVGEALAAAGTMIALLTDRVEMQVETNDKYIRVSQVASSAQSGISSVALRQLQDFFTAFVVHELDGLILQKVVPSNVIVPVFTENQKHEYNRILRCVPVGNGSMYAIRFPVSLWTLPVMPARFEQQQYLAKVVTESLQQLQHTSGFTNKVKRFLLQQTYLGLPSIEDVAANFQLTPRTLQRYLKKEGTSFSILQAGARKKVALELLKTGNRTIGDIAYQLGYLETSAFIRAFRRWTGDSPTVYLQKQKAVAG